MKVDQHDVFGCVCARFLFIHVCVREFQRKLNKAEGVWGLDKVCVCVDYDKDSCGNCRRRQALHAHNNFLFSEPPGDRRHEGPPARTFARLFSHDFLRRPALTSCLCTRFIRFF